MTTEENQAIFNLITKWRNEAFRHFCDSTESDIGDEESLLHKIEADLLKRCSDELWEIMAKAYGA